VPEYRWQSHRIVRPLRVYLLDRSWSPDGWPLVADDLWRVVHSDRSGVRQVDPAAVGLGLGAALLIELALCGQIVLAGGRLHLAEDLEAFLRHRGRPAVGSGAPGWPSGGGSVLPDRAADELLMVIFREPQPLPVDDWLAFAAQRAYEKVARRMLDAGHVREQRTRRLLSRHPVYPPVDMNVAGWPPTRLAMPLRSGSGDPLDLDVVLLGLCREIGVTHWIFDDLPAGAVEAFCRRPEALAAPLPELLSRLAAAIAAASARLR